MTVLHTVVHTVCFLQGIWNENCLHSTAQLIINFASANEQLDNGMQTQSLHQLPAIMRDWPVSDHATFYMLYNGTQNNKHNATHHNKHNTMQHNNKMQYNTKQHNTTTKCTTTQCNTTQRNTTQRNTTQCNTTQHNGMQHECVYTCTCTLYVCCVAHKVYQSSLHASLFHPGDL